MTKQEMRFLRRELINHYIHTMHRMLKKTILNDVKFYVRRDESFIYGFELQAYK